MKKKMKSILKYGIHILFVICAYLTIRWSDLSAPNNKLIEILFVHKGAIDSAMLNTVTGYITGYIVYVLTVLYPDMKRKRPVRKLAMNRLAIIYSESIYILLLMCKNCCKNEAEWTEVIRDNDIECFNDKFIEVVKKFDISSIADTILRHADNDSRLKWYEYLHKKYENMYNRLDYLFLQYQYYLNEEDIETISNLKNSNYFDALLGLGEQLSNRVDGEDNYGYFDSFSLLMIYSQPNKMSPIFSDNNNVENSRMLIEYIEILQKTHNHLKKYKKKYGLEILREDYAVGKLKQKNVGHLGTAIIDTNDDTLDS